MPDRLTPAADPYRDLLMERVAAIDERTQKIVTDVAVIVERGATDRSEITELRKKTDWLYGKVASLAVAVGGFAAIAVEWLKGMLPHK